jgi:hypothetical protein
MHLAGLNILELMINLWQGSIAHTHPDDKSTWDWAVLRGDTWQQHGKDVKSALHYLPTSFDRPPRNIAEKITSGYKAWEFLLYLYGLGPGLLYGILPEKYFTNYCKLVLGIRLVSQHRITLANVREAHSMLLSFALEFERIYCRRLSHCIHFVRPCLHALTHLPREILRIGPPICSSQWTLECTIGNLGAEIKQPSNPFANLSQQGIRHARMNALMAIIPDLDANNYLGRALPRSSEDLTNGYTLLRARDKHGQRLREYEVEAL